MAAKEYWKIDNEKIQKNHKFIGIGELEKFSFNVTRLKDTYSYEEVLKIEAYYDSKEYGSRISKISKLETEITALSDIGINLSRLEFIELSTIIKRNYYQLEPQIREAIENNISDIVVKGVVDFFKEYITEKEIEPKDGYYNIPIEDFKREFNDSVFKRYNISDIKEALKIRDYIKCNARRNDFAIKENGVNKRYICFDIKKIEE